MNRTSAEQAFEEALIDVLTQDYKLDVRHSGDALDRRRRDVASLSFTYQHGRRGLESKVCVHVDGAPEFSSLLPGANADEAQAVAERVRTAVQERAFPGEDQQPGGSLTVSLGVATLGSSAPDALKERADAALYDAKSEGRNRVVVV